MNNQNDPIQFQTTHLSIFAEMRGVRAMVSTRVAARVTAWRAPPRFNNCSLLFSSFSSRSSNSPPGGGCSSTSLVPNEAGGAASPTDEDDDDMVEMFVEGPAGVEWGGPTRGGKYPEPTRFGDWEYKGRVSDF